MSRGSGAFAAYIDNVGAGRRHGEAGRYGSVPVQEVAAITETVGRDVEHPHDAGAIEAETGPSVGAHRRVDGATMRQPGQRAYNPAGSIECCEP